MNIIINIAVFGDYGTRRIKSAVIKEFNAHGFPFALHMASQPDAPYPFVIDDRVYKYSTEAWAGKVKDATLG